MDERYKPQEIEQRWQRIWREREAYRTPDTSDRPKFYCLDFFPYPSGDGLSVGHLRNYVPTDRSSRYQRMRGFNVLHPMGWDAFGLPAENYAIKMGVSPRVTTARNIANYHRQMDLVGLSFDWSREITSCEPDYYRWTQWFFLLMYERGLAYRGTGQQWWCPVDKTILANEQVHDGRCWRCGSEVTKVDLEQWYFAHHRVRAAAARRPRHDRLARADQAACRPTGSGAPRAPRSSSPCPGAATR